MENEILYKNCRISYYASGTGHPVVFLHGFCEDKRMWSEFIRDFQGQGYRLIRIDLPGFGGSEVLEDLTVAEMAGVVRAVIEWECRDEQVVLVGHSMGGYAALAYAHLYGSGVAGLVLFHSHPFADSQARKNNRQKSIRFIEKYGAQAFVVRLFEPLFYPANREKHLSKIRQLSERARTYPARGIIGAQRAMLRRSDTSAVLANAQFPVLFLIGKEDTTISPEQNISQTELPFTSTRVILDEVGHMGMFEATTVTQKAILEFVLHLQASF